MLYPWIYIYMNRLTCSIDRAFSATLIASSRLPRSASSWTYELQSRRSVALAWLACITCNVDRIRSIDQRGNKARRPRTPYVACLRFTRRSELCEAQDVAPEGLPHTVQQYQVCALGGIPAHISQHVPTLAFDRTAQLVAPITQKILIPPTGISRLSGPRVHARPHQTRLLRSFLSLRLI